MDSGRENEDWDKKVRDRIQRVRQDARTKSLEAYTGEKEKAILEVVQVYGINGKGITHKDLSYLADLDRKSLRRYTQELMKKGLIMRDGVHAKYLPTDLAYKDPLLNATLFGRNFRFELFNKDEDLVLCNKIIKDLKLMRSIDCNIYTSYYKPMFTDEDEIERTLFEFSNRLGAFITYALIQSMSSKNNNLSLPTRGQDELANTWVHNSISQILPFLIWYFRDFAYKAVNQYPRHYDKKVEFMKKNPKFLLDKKNIDKLLTAFAKLYPRLTYEFERIINESPEQSASYKKYMESLHKKLKQQEICKHEYKEPTMTIYGYYGKQCSKCQHIKKVKRPISSKISIR